MASEDRLHTRQYLFLKELRHSPEGCRITLGRDVPRIGDSRSSRLRFLPCPFTEKDE